MTLFSSRGRIFATRGMASLAGIGFIAFLAVLVLYAADTTVPEDSQFAGICVGTAEECATAGGATGGGASVDDNSISSDVHMRGLVKECEPGKIYKIELETTEETPEGDESVKVTAEEVPGVTTPPTEPDSCGVIYCPPGVGAEQLTTNSSLIEAGCKIVYARKGERDGTEMEVWNKFLDDFEKAGVPEQMASDVVTGAMAGNEGYQQILTGLGGSSSMLGDAIQEQWEGEVNTRINQTTQKIEDLGSQLNAIAGMDFTGTGVRPDTVLLEAELEAQRQQLEQLTGMRDNIASMYVPTGPSSGQGDLPGLGLIDHGMIGGEDPWASFYSADGTFEQSDGLGTSFGQSVGGAGGGEGQVTSGGFFNWAWCGVKMTVSPTFSGGCLPADGGVGEIQTGSLPGSGDPTPGSALPSAPLGNVARDCHYTLFGCVNDPALPMELIEGQQPPTCPPQTTRDSAGRCVAPQPPRIETQPPPRFQPPPITTHQQVLTRACNEGNMTACRQLGMQPPMGGGAPGSQSPLGQLGQMLTQALGGGQQQQAQSQCQQQYICTGNQLYHRAFLNNQCVSQFVQNCQYGCAQEGSRCATPQERDQQLQDQQRPIEANLSCAPREAAVGSPVVISWACQNATASRGDGFNTGTRASGATQVPMPEGGARATFAVTCIHLGQTATETCSVDEVAADEETPSSGELSATLSCSPELVDVGMSVAVSWACKNAQTSQANGFDSEGKMLGVTHIDTSTVPDRAIQANYQIACARDGLVETSSCKVELNRPSVAIAANPGSIAHGTTTRIGWLSRGVESCEVSSPDIDDFTGQGKSGVLTTPPLTESATVVISCTTLGGEMIQKEIEIEVGEANEGEEG